jgi:cell division protein ZapE
MVDEQGLRSDDGQLVCANKLEVLRSQLCADNQLEEQVAAKRSAGRTGLYLYGGVGCGKTMLMDLFFDATPSTVKKRRVHFHDFMIKIHESLREEQERILKEEGGLKLEVLPGGYLGRRKKVELFGVELYTVFEYDAFDPFKESTENKERNDEKIANHIDPLIRIAEKISAESSLLCFDEFQVTDIADAMILQRLFEKLFAEGVVMVATSNREPSELYKGGVQREAFLPFIDLIQEQCELHDMESRTDYRLLAWRDERADSIFVYPTSDPKAKAKFEDAWTHLTRSTEAAPAAGVIRINNRDLAVPLMHPSNTPQIARFHFTDLCDAFLGEWFCCSHSLTAATRRQRSNQRRGALHTHHSHHIRTIATIAISTIATISTILHVSHTTFLPYPPYPPYYMPPILHAYRTSRDAFVLLLIFCTPYLLKAHGISLPSATHSTRSSSRGWSK